jgi:hypothetical protein
MDKINKAVFSFWSKPFFIKSGIRSFGGFTTINNFYNSWIVAVCSAAKLFDEVELITDVKGEELLKPLNLPFTNIKVELNNIDHIHHNLWAVGKMYAYSIQEKPFVHLDYDFYLFEKILIDARSAGFICQELETYDKSFYNDILKKYIESNNKTEYEIAKYMFNHGNRVFAINCGVFGGFDIDKINYYAKLSLSICENMNNLQMHNINYVDVADSLFPEQYLAGMIINNHKIPVYTIRDKIKFTHLISSTKQNPEVMNILYNYVNKHHTEYTKKIPII